MQLEQGWAKYAVRCQVGLSMTCLAPAAGDRAWPWASVLSHPTLPSGLLGSIGWIGGGACQEPLWWGGRAWRPTSVAVGECRDGADASSGRGGPGCREGRPGCATAVGRVMLPLLSCCCSGANPGPAAGNRSACMCAHMCMHVGVCGPQQLTKAGEVALQPTPELEEPG